jgi:hypothetical protein
MQRKRNKFREWPAVTTKVKMPAVGNGASKPEPEILAVAEWFRERDPSGVVMAEVIRDSIDILLDGQRTGRWCYGHLSKTEKTHLGTVIEIELQKEWDISDDGPLDYAIAGIPVDCKYSAQFGNWQIPREMYRRIEEGVHIGQNHIALLVWADERSRTWRAGLIRITARRLGGGKNQDKKRTLRPDALGGIYWIWPATPPLPENTLLELPEAERAAIFAFPKSGQARINELLRRVQLKTLRRTVILTVAQQDDGLKRPRDARNDLRCEGILVFGHEKAHHRVARDLGVDRRSTVDHLPEKGEFVAARVRRVEADDPRPKTLLEKSYWAIAGASDPPAPGPNLPRK